MARKRKQWDSLMKSLVSEKPQDYVNWLMGDAMYEGREESELRSRQIDVDGFYRVRIKGNPYLVHIEFQKRSDTKMEQRLWEYNMLATRQYGVPVYSYVFYLVQNRQVAQSPYQVLLADGLPVHQFRFWPIELWEQDTEQMLQTSSIGLLPLIPLTKNGHDRAVIDQVIEILYDKGHNPKGDLLALTYGLAALVMTDEQEQDWLQRRFGVLDDILEDSWAFKKLRQKAREEALKQGRDEGLREGLEETLFSLIQVRFPGLMTLAREQRSKFTDYKSLQKLVVELSIARSEEEARALLHEQ